MKLSFADGRSFVGRSFGAEGPVRGEVVFNTGMSGYVEALTDPSYRGQILVMTYPLQGNYGVPDGPWESEKIQVQGLVVHGYTEGDSHRLSRRTLGEWLKDEGIPGICGIDTRRLTLYLRNLGTVPGVLGRSKGDFQAQWDEAQGVNMKRVVEDVSGESIIRVSEGQGSILLIDTGAKDSIVRCLTQRGAGVIRAPFESDWESLLGQVDGVVLSNGPGNPGDMRHLSDRIVQVLDAGIPTLGICLGHQLLAQAAGGKTFKLPFGHRSLNQPVQEAGSGSCFVTSQNHGYAVDPASLKKGWLPWFTNLNDQSNEGIRHSSKPFMSVQFHPEAAGGPRDTAYLFDTFLDQVRGRMNP